MRRIRIRHGRDLVLGDPPDPTIDVGRDIRSVALLGRDHIGFRPLPALAVGTQVALGQPLMEHRRHEGVVATSPGSGVVTRIERGARRALQAVVVELEGEARVQFPAPARSGPESLPRDEVIALLLRSGLWTALRERPFDRVPAPRTTPRALFVTAIDTRPLAPAVDPIVGARLEDFRAGLAVLRRLTTGAVYLCRAPGSDVDAGEVEGIEVAEFAGPHPAGLVGTHIHQLAPASRRRPAWYIGHQDVLAIGRLFTSGHLDVERVVALGGPCVRRPRLVCTRVGASLLDLLVGELREGPARIVSGCALHGHEGAGVQAFLGRYDDQVTVLPEDPRGLSRVSTAQHGRRTTWVPVEAFERVLPFDTLPGPLLRALIVGDAERARDLGCLELAEEDLSLASHVCPAKQDYGALLRAVLDRIEREG